MLFAAQPIFVKGTSLMTDITNLGLTTNLRLCLDAGDIQSYPGSGQPWFDLSGGGYDFNRGATSGSEASDPTFAGTAGGLSSSERFSGDGGDYFTYDSANETWMKALFKAGSASFFAVVYLPTDAVMPIFSTETSSTPGSYGGSFKYDAGNNRFAYAYAVSGGGSFQLAVFGTDVTSSLPGVFMLGLGISVDSGGNADFVASQNGVPDSASGATSVPATNDPAQVAKILATGNAGEIAANTARIYEIAIWQGTKLSAANLAALYAARKNKYGL